MSITKGLRVGDVVRHTRTLEVTCVKDDYVELHDTVEPLLRIGLFTGHRGSDKIEVISKAKPKAGDVITGNELLDMPLQEGTIIKGLAAGRIYMLNAKGEWACSNGRNLAFSEMGGNWTGKLLHVA